MRIDVITIFPEFFDSALRVGLVHDALMRGPDSVHFTNPRDFATDRHRTVDDAPYGGGPGMVMKPEPIVRALEHTREQSATSSPHVVLLTPSGNRLRQSDLERLSKRDHVVLIAGRYEGIDARVLATVDEELSIGDYVLTGGEYAALVLIDGIIRLRPGTLHNNASVGEESFGPDFGLIEYAHYTRPPVFRGVEVPAVLRSGDHQKIREFRLKDALERTLLRRPDLLFERGIRDEEHRLLSNRCFAPRTIGAVVDLASETTMRTEAVAAAFGVSRLWICALPPTDAVDGSSGSREWVAERDDEKSRSGAGPVNVETIGSLAVGIKKAREVWPNACVVGYASELADVSPRAARERVDQDARPLVVCPVLPAEVPPDASSLFDMRLGLPGEARQSPSKLGAAVRLALMLDRILSNG